MSFSVKYFLASCLALTMTLPAFGQRMRMMGGHPMHPHMGPMMRPGMAPMVFRNPSVHPIAQPMFQMSGMMRQPNMTPHQFARLNTTTMQAQPGQLGMLNTQQRQFQAMQLMGNLNTDLLRAAGTVLNPHQMSILKQVEMQSRGLATFTNPAVQKQLGLTQNQVSGLHRGSVRNQRLMSQINAMSVRNPQAAFNTLQSMLTEAENLLGATLTAQQLAAWTSMMGSSYGSMPVMYASVPYPRYANGYGTGYSQGQTYGEGYDQTPAAAETSSATGYQQHQLVGRIENRKQTSAFPEPLFRLDHVARKLSLTPEQFDHLNTLTAQLQQRYAPQLEKLASLNEKERQDGTRDLLRAYSADWMKGAADILSARQMADYREFVKASGNP